MKIVYKIDDHFLTDIFEKITKITKVTIDQVVDYTIEVDYRNYFIILSDIQEFVDPDGVEHIEDRLELLELFKQYNVGEYIEE